MKRAVLMTLLLCDCQRAPAVKDTPGSGLEAAAIARGLVPDPASASPVGLWANDTDRLCVVPAGPSLRLGVAVGYGEGQGCAASGVAQRGKDRLSIAFGDCTFDAKFDGERIVFPAELPAACERFCNGRASLTAVAVERLSESVSEAATLRVGRGKPLCGG